MADWYMKQEARRKHERRYGRQVSGARVFYNKQAAENWRAAGNLRRASHEVRNMLEAEPKEEMRESSSALSATGSRPTVSPPATVANATACSIQTEF